MNVVIVNDFAYVDGGASKIALGSAEALAGRGHRVILLSAVGPVAANLADVAGLEVICMGVQEIAKDANRARAAVQGLWNVQAGRRMNELLQTLPAEDTIVHVHTWTKGLSASVIRAALLRGFPVVVTLHDYFTVCPNGGFFLYPQERICTLRPMSAGCIATHCDSRGYSQKLWRVGRQWIQNHIGLLPRGVEHFISISDLSERKLKPYLPATATLHRVRNFIDVEQRPAVPVDENKTFVFSGRLAAEKGPALLAECAHKLNLELLFIGDGPMRQQLGEIAPRAAFTGWISSLDAQTALRRSRALVAPSLWPETQGLVVAEAAAMGIPAVISDTSAACEWVLPEVTGLYFKTGDADDLSRQLRRLQESPQMAAAMGHEAYRRYWANPATMEAHCQELERTYATILSSRQPQAGRMARM